MRYKFIDYEYSSLPSGTEKHTATRVTPKRKVTVEGRKPVLLLRVRFFADGNFRAHSRILPTLTRSTITEANNLEELLMVEVKIRPFGILDKGKILIILIRYDTTSFRSVHLF